MTRVKRGFVARRRRKKVLKRAKGFRGSIGKLFIQSKQAVYHALRYATTDRRTRKGDFRRLWNIRIGAGTQQLGLSYSKFINGLKKKGIIINRKMLSELATNDFNAFTKIVELVKGK